MTIRGIGVLVGCAACVLLGGLPAAAIDDVTGTYTGKLSCRQILSGATSKLKQDVTVEVVESPAGEVALDIVAGTTDIALEVIAFLVEDAAKPDRGALTGLSCTMNAGFRTGGTVYAELAIKAGSEKGKLRGTVIAMDDGDGLAKVCTFTAKRTSTAEPTIGSC